MAGEVPQGQLMVIGPEEFRGSLSRFATGVTVVTVASNGELHGMTASSFASVSLEPPLILVSLDKSSKTLALVLSSGRFAVNVLSDGQEKIARDFARRGMKPFDDLPHRAGRSTAPLLEGAIAWVECVIHQVVDAGDHNVVIGEVVATDMGAGRPLLYFERGYRSLDG